jgi:hypothetical protein
MCAAAATAAVSYEGGSCKFGYSMNRNIWLTNVLFFFLLVKAFLAKAKDEFQVKYDKPSQVC